jgi:hypothetical protein
MDEKQQNDFQEMKAGRLSREEYGRRWAKRVSSSDPKSCETCRHFGRHVKADGKVKTKKCGTCPGSPELPLHWCGAGHGEVLRTDGTECPDYRPRPVPWQLLLTGGIGDIFAVESFLTPEERETLAAIHWASPQAEAGRQLFEALPNYPCLTEHHVLSSGPAWYYMLAEVEQRLGHLPAGTRDGSIQKVFAESRTYSGSSFLQHFLCPVVAPTEPYALIHPFSANRFWEGRDFDASDWAVCLAYLQRSGLRGLVIYRGEDQGKIPASDLLVPHGNATDILESVELLKRAKAFLGIDSCLSVLAAKLFPAIAVKSVWQHCYDWKHRYYAPRTDFGFLNRRLIAPC